MAGTTEPPSTDERAEDTQPLADRAFEHGKHVYEGAVTVIVSVVLVACLVIALPLALIGMVLRRLLPIVGLLALISGVVVLGGIWAVPEQILDPVTQRRQIAATGRAIVMFFGTGIGAILVGAAIDEAFERLDAI